MTELDSITEASAVAVDPSIVPVSKVNTGGVDPLGLRQINFNLMDQVIPGINNVAVHVRPFVLVTWAWRRACFCAEQLNLRQIETDVLRDFVDRIEVIYAWSQFLRDSGAGLPGREVLRPIIKSDKWIFGGDEWKARRDIRRYSTSFMAPINYGPALRTLGWLVANENDASVFVPTIEVEPALDGFEKQIEGILDHPVFNEFGSVSVEASDVARWADVWALDKPTVPEQSAMADALFGDRADLRRQAGGALMIAAVRHAETSNVEVVRRTMSGHPSDFAPASELENTQKDWRFIQVRQLFRLSLEALLYWITLQIREHSKLSEALVTDFLQQTNTRPDETTSQWLGRFGVPDLGPTDVMDMIVNALTESSDENLETAIAHGLAFSIGEAPSEAQQTDRLDRLPVYRAGQDASRHLDQDITSFTKHVFESWVFSQHVYWSLGRALGDARSRGKHILRLKVILEEDGWTLAPGVVASSNPRPTPDRLRTAISLASECNLI